jgi:hypothetical protein
MNFKSLKILRVEQGMTTEKVAERCKIPAVRLRAIEDGLAEPVAWERHALSQVFETQINYRKAG